MPETRVIINLSNRHIHLSVEDLEILFGQGRKLTKTKDLMQPGEFSTEESVTIVGPRNKLEGIRVLGPTRAETQCEILASDVFRLGVPGCPVKESGMLDGSFPFEIVGPAGSVKKQRGLIIAKRHVHFDLQSAVRFDVKDKEIVSLRVDGDRGVTFHNVVCRVKATYALECHLDFDEGNAALIGNGSFGEIVKR